MTKAIFITGTSGTGKTTLVQALKNAVGSDTVVIDIDDMGVPTNPNANWRKETTGEIIQLINTNADKGLSTIVCGVTVPEEIKSFPLNDGVGLVFGLLEILPDTIRKRLSERKWQLSTIEDNIIWAEHLKRFVTAEPNHFIIDSENNTSEDIARKIIKDLQGKGLGKFMIYEMLKEIKKHSTALTYLLLSTSPDQTFYEKIGMKRVGELDVAKHKRIFYALEVE